MTTQTAYGTATTVQIEAQWCPSCGIPYGTPEGFLEQRRKDRQSFYCPNGHSLSYPAGKSDATKLKEAATRETALRDQLNAAVRETERTRKTIIRDRQRFAEGLCPCCDQTFSNVRTHMARKHPAYDAKVLQPALEFACSCRRSFATAKGLQIHQSHQRRTTGGYRWDDPKTPGHMQHLTEV